jgi:uncharacterized membrane protein
MRGFGLGFQHGVMFPGVGMIICLVFFLALIATVVWLVVWAVRRNKRDAKVFQSQSQIGPGPKEIVQARYARGEITQAEYKKILADLEN